MAAYAALVSLMNTIDNIQNHTGLSTSLDKNQIESLGEKLASLLDFVENNHCYGGNEGAEVLESQIAFVAHAAEDVIESHILDQIEAIMAGFTFDHEETSSSLLLEILVNIMRLIKNHSRLLTSLDRKRIESLGEKLDIFLNVIENHNSHVGPGEAEVLESQIASEALAVADTLKSSMDRTKSLVAEYIDDGDMRSRILLDLLILFLELILNYPRHWTSCDRKDIEFFVEGVNCIQGMIVNTYNSDEGISKEEVEDLETQMASAALVAKFAIESHIMDQIESHEAAGSTIDHGETSSSSMLDLPKEVNAMKKKVMKVHKKICGKKVLFAGSSNSVLPDLQQILEDMDFVKEKVNKVNEERGFRDLPSTYSIPTDSSRPLNTGKTALVGFDCYLVQLLDWLTTEQSNLQIISITGMGGIGKTTLARSVYRNSLIEQHFDVCSWITVSQEYNVREMLFQTLCGLVECPDQKEELGKSPQKKKLENKTEDELGVLLHKTLYGRRYLIILDDMWSIETWNKISLYFPREEKRSRIVVTTRQSDVANYFGSLRLALNFLDYDRSWDLFCEKAFENGCCPAKLENIGRKIVKKCKGLPLSIVVIAGLLGKSSTKLEHWENVEKDLSSILNSAEDNQCFNILFVSYSHLPTHLKPCFLYLGIFSEDHEIRVSRLIKLWVAEGFLKPNKELSLEEVAKGNIEDLVNRNLLLVRSLSMNGKVKTFSVHDLLRDLCIKVAEKEKFFYLMSKLDTPQDIGRQPRLISLESIAEECRPLHSTSLVRSIISESSCHLSSRPRLLRVFSNAYGGSLDAAFQQFNLRFLECHPKYMSIPSYKLPSSIFLLWNLQTLIIECFEEVVAPSEIWEMQQLRHLQLHRVYLHNPPFSNKQDRIVLRNLQTLEVAWTFRFSVEVCKRMSNIKKLSIFFGDNLWVGDTLAYYCFYNVGCLNKLESLYFNSREVPEVFSQNLKLPSSLKKLVLQHCGLNWDDLTRIGSLPHLEVLKLDWESVRGFEWNPIEGGFLRLKYLRISKCSDLLHWNADSSHFPVLENLVIEELSKLGEIPSGIGDIPTLRDIYLVDCSDTVVISAVNILKDQESCGNQDLQVRVKFWNDTARENARRKVELEGFPSHNFRLS